MFDQLTGVEQLSVLRTVLADPSSRLQAKINNWDYTLPTGAIMVGSLLQTIIRALEGDKPTFTAPWPWPDETSRRQAADRAAIRGLSVKERAALEARLAEFSAIQH